MCVHLTTEIKSSKVFNRNKRKYQSAEDFSAQDWAGLALQLIRAPSGMGFTSRGKRCPAESRPKQALWERRIEAVRHWGTIFQHQKGPDASDFGLAGKAFLWCTQTTRPCILFRRSLLRSAGGERLSTFKMS